MADFTSNNSANVNNVNSNGIALFAADGHMLRVAFRNEMLILTIIPKIVGEDGRPRWPKDFGKTVMLRPQNCAALHEQTEKFIVPCILNAQDYDGYVVVPTNRDNTNLVGFAYHGGKVSLSIFLGVGADRRCADTTTFIFDTLPVITQYNPDTGKYQVAESQGQFQVVLLLLKACAMLLSGVPGQSTKTAMSFNTNQIIAYVRAIATKLGVTPSAYGNFVGPRDDGSGFGGTPFRTDTSGGADGTTSWNMGAADNAMMNHGMNGPDIQQLSSLEALMPDTANLDTNPAPLQQLS